MSLNKTGVDYADRSWNPITGCSRRCWYCYARRLAFTRLRGRAGYPADDPFRPTFHPKRLADLTPRQKPQTIFVGDMGDLFDPAFGDDVLARVACAMASAPQHRYLLLTKQAGRMALTWRQFCTDNPAGVWFGVTITGLTDIERVSAIQSLPNAWVSYEPILGPLADNVLKAHPWVRWWVLGALTGADSLVRMRWVGPVISEAKRRRVPVFLKANLAKQIPSLEHIQEAPW